MGFIPSFKNQASKKLTNFWCKVMKLHNLNYPVAKSFRRTYHFSLFRTCDLSSEIMLYLSKIKCVPRLLKLKAAKWYATDIWKCHVSIVKRRKTVEFQFNFRPRFLHFWASGIHMFLVQHILARHPFFIQQPTVINLKVLTSLEVCK